MVVFFFFFSTIPHQVMDGIDTVPPRWQLCVDRTQGALGHATGALFVQKKVTKSVKTEVSLPMAINKQKMPQKI